MHVVQLGKYYPPQRGGIETVVEGLARGLVRRGHEVTVVVSNDCPRDADERIDGVRVIRVARRALIASQPINPGLTRALSELSFDVLHVHTPNPLGALAALVASRGRPLVVSHHSDIVEQKLLGLPGRLAHAALYARASAIVAATPLHVRYSAMLRRFEERCRVIPFSLPERPNGSPAPPILPSGWLERPLALFVGRLVHYKGLQVLLDALAKCPSLRLAVVGSGPLRAQLVQKARDLGIEQRVAFVGNVSDQALQALYSACRFLVLPSILESEAFGLVQLEAMAAGRPVISTNLRSGVPYVNQHGRTGLLVPPGDAAALAAAMLRLCEDDALCARLGRAARLRVAEFGEESVLDRWVELYAELSAPAEAVVSA